MTCWKKLWALLLSAALALSLLAGCGGSKALSRVIANLLSGMYDNVAVETDSDLTAALKKAAAEGGSEEEILARLVEDLNLAGGSLTLNQLGAGQQGEHSVSLVFQSGSDPDAAARNALSRWAGAFGSLPKDGRYTARVAMIEAEGGYYIAVNAEVTKAGTPDKDKPEFTPKDSVVENDDGSVTYYVATKEGLLNWAQAANTDNIIAHCTLLANISLTGVEWDPIGGANYSYKGTFDGNHHTITGLTINAEGEEYVGFFGWISGNSTSQGTVKDLTLANVNITSGGDSDQNYTGGVVGWNAGTGTGTGCTVTGTVTVTSSGSGVKCVGGVVGDMSGGTVTACYHANGNVTATHGTTSGGISITVAGGVVGRCPAFGVSACYWSGSSSSYGIGMKGGQRVTKEPTDCTNRVLDNATWKEAMDAMNAALQEAGCRWKYVPGSGAGPLQLKKIG